MNKLKTMTAALVAGTVGALATAQNAIAGPIADAVEAEVTTGRAELDLVFATLIILVGALAVWGFIKRGAR